MGPLLGTKQVIRIYLCSGGRWRRDNNKRLLLCRGVVSDTGKGRTGGIFNFGLSRVRWLRKHDVQVRATPSSLQLFSQIPFFSDFLMVCKACRISHSELVATCRFVGSGNKLCPSARNTIVPPTILTKLLFRLLNGLSGMSYFSFRADREGLGPFCI